MKRKLFFCVWILCLCTGVSAKDYQSEYTRVKHLFETRDKKAQTGLQQYMQTYPYTPYVDEVRLMRGVLYTEAQQYRHAEKQFDTIRIESLTRGSEQTYYFYLGYAYIQMKAYDKGLACMIQLKNQSGIYQTQAKYYAGYCYYCKGDFQHAMADFMDVEQIGAFPDVVPYYIIQIDFAKGQYDRVLQRAEELLKLYPQNANNAELSRMVGEIYFNRGDYANAIRQLEICRRAFEKQHKPLPRADMYLLGIAFYKQTQYADAIAQLRRVPEMNDTISECACYHLGHCYLRLGDEEKARLNYAAAMRYGFTPTIREEAMFNYVQITYHQSSALGESIRAFREFLAEFPNTRHADEVNNLLSDMLLSSKDYVGAYMALKEVKSTHPKMLETMQYLRYQIGVDAYLQGKMPSALGWFRELLHHRAHSDVYTNEAYYLMADAFFQLRQYDSCLYYVNKLDNAPAWNKSANYMPSCYLKAYALFNTAQWNAAKAAFIAYIEKVDQQDRTYRDALCRLGDCYFTNRLFTEAIQAYGKVAQTPGIATDYALYQQGYSYGLLHQYENKIQSLKPIIDNYPKSDYASMALYETARAQWQLKHYDQAVTAYQQLLTTYPHSPRAAKSSLEMAMAYRTMRDYDKAKVAFQQTIEQYPSSEEAYTALDGLEQVSVETNQLAAYLTYVRGIKSMNVTTVNKEDSLTYVTAELQYMMGNYQQAADGMNNYIHQFAQGGRYLTQARHYAADSYYKIHQNDSALIHYMALADIAGNPYREEACLRSAELTYDKQQYAASKQYFEQVVRIASTKEIRQTAELGVLRTNVQLSDSADIILSATQLIDEIDLPDNMMQEARYARAKAHMAAQHYGMAVVDFTPLSQEVRTAMGAESKYQLAQCYFELGSMDLAEQEIMDFTRLQTSQQYWLARSLILLSDIYRQRADLFQAKQYLLTLQTNYHRADNIADLVNQRMAIIRDLEQQLIQTEETEENL